MIVLINKDKCSVDIDIDNREVGGDVSGVGPVVTYEDDLRVERERERERERGLEPQLVPILHSTLTDCPLPATPRQGQHFPFLSPASS